MIEKTDIDIKKEEYLECVKEGECLKEGECVKEGKGAAIAIFKENKKEEKPSDNNNEIFENTHTNVSIVNVNSSTCETSELLSAFSGEDPPVLLSPSSSPSTNPPTPLRQEGGRRGVIPPAGELRRGCTLFDRFKNIFFFNNKKNKNINIHNNNNILDYHYNELKQEIKDFINYFIRLIIKQLYPYIYLFIFIFLVNILLSIFIITLLLKLSQKYKN